MALRWQLKPGIKTGWLPWGWCAVPPFTALAGSETALCVSHKILVSFLIFPELQRASFGGVFFQITFLLNWCLIKNLLTRRFYSASTTILRCERRSSLFFNPLRPGTRCPCAYSSALTLCSFCLRGSSNLAELGAQSPRCTSAVTDQLESVTQCTAGP